MTVTDGAGMKAFAPYGDLDARVHVSLSEAEAKALWALACYGADGFLRVFYKEMGEAYLKPHEKGLRSLFANAATQVEAVSRHIDTSREVFRGTMVAVWPEDLKRLHEAVAELRA